MVHIFAYGSISFSELKEIFYETVRHQDWQPGFNLLCDYRKVADFAINSQDIADIIAWQKIIDELIGSGKCAVVANKDFVRGMNLMWRIFPVDSSNQIKVFCRMNEAISWLS